MSIHMFPELIWAYHPGRSDTEINIEDDLAELWIKLPDEEIEKLVDAISSDVIAKLPDWFQWGREKNNPDVFRLFTTRHHKKV